MVPPAEFTSYYGRPILKAPVWKSDIPAYLFLGGLAGGSSLLAAGADVTGRPALRRAGRVTGLVAVLASFGALVHDLGQPKRFLHMLRVAKPTSPMSVGTWILTVYGPAAGLAAVSEATGVLPAGLRDGVVGRLLPGAGRAGGWVAAGLAPALATYTAVLIADTATPAWHEGYRELPGVFAGGAAVAAGGLAMMAVPVGQAAPARRLAVAGTVVDLALARRMEKHMGLVGETFRQGKAGPLMRAARVLTAGGAVLGGLLGGRSRAASVVGGAALVAGSVCTRFGVFEAGVASAKDPKYVVVPQRERMAARAESGEASQ